MPLPQGKLAACGRSIPIAPKLGLRPRRRDFGALVPRNAAASSSGALTLQPGFESKPSYLGDIRANSTEHRNTFPTGARATLLIFIAQ